VSLQPPAGYLTAKDAAAYLGVSYRGFDQFVRRHGVPFKRYGRKRLFTRASLDRVVETMALRKAG
jgi:excisionase family DNA binding protein